MARPKNLCPDCHLPPLECLGHDDIPASGGCDAAEFGAAATFLPDGSCRCTVCSRCGHHTGNSHQGHYWAWCKATHTVREHHLCCPDPVSGCELESGAPEACHTE